jgi:peptide/nickel transport system permease protein
MITYVVSRLLQSFAVMLIISLLVFFAMRLLPADPVLLLVSPEELARMSNDEIELLRHNYGLDKPLLVQYIDWIGGALHGDLGKSMRLQVSVSSEIVRCLPVTFYLGSIALILSIVIGIPAGIVSATKRAKAVDTIVTALANIGMTVPVFWLAFILVYIFALKLRWLPVAGFTFPFNNFALSMKQMIMPVVCLSLGSISVIARQTRSSMLDVIYQDYIRTAWSKGLTERIIILRHALKNSLIPVVTLIGLQIRNLFAGAVLVEIVFNIPGMGRLGVDALYSRDYWLLQGVTLIIAVVVVLSNLIIDVSYGWLDPRVRFK